MSMTPARGLALAVLVLAAGLAATEALAQASPFGAARPPMAAAEAGGVVGWIIARQAEFYRAISGTLRAAKTDGSAVTTLLWISFLYGVFHAAGPGHGKAVISSYVVANEQTARRGIMLSFASALLQALVAIAIVGIGAWAFGATSKALCDSERVIEMISYGLIALLGLRLVWTKGRGFFDAWRWYAGRAAATPALAAAGASAAAVPAAHGHGSHHHDHHHHHGHDHGHHHGHDHKAGHEVAHEAGLVGDAPPAACCDHAHTADLAALEGPQGWRNALSAILAVGLRPCSGAILVLVFALAQGMFWAGIVATLLMGLGTAITVAAIATLAIAAKDVARRLASGRSGFGTVAMRFVEFGAAGLVLLFGVGLLIGYAAAERVSCF